MYFSLIIPCYNESPNLPLLIERCNGFVENPNVEIILVDNGSTDKSPKILKNLCHGTVRSISIEKNQGYGFGILTGLKAAKGDILGWTHADMQTDPLDFLSGISLFDRHGKNIFVKGRREGRPFTDVFFTIGMSLFETILLRKPMWDINAQPTIFSRNFFETWKNPPYDFSLDLYSYYQAHEQNIPVYRFPVKFERRIHGISRWNINGTAKKKFIKRTVKFSLQLKKGIEHENTEK